jgi:hypothetical protein
MFAEVLSRSKAARMLGDSLKPPSLYSSRTTILQYGVAGAWVWSGNVGVEGDAVVLRDLGDVAELDLSR